jgi:hypothetical protein
MKTRFLYVFFFALLGGILLTSNSGGRGAAGGSAATGAPGEGVCAGCHGGASGFPTINIQMRDGSNNPVTSYIGGQTYSLRIQISGGPGGSQYGAQATVLNSANNTAGTLSAPGTGAQITTVGLRRYLEHTNRSVSGVFGATWTAPIAGTGTVTVWAAGIFCNANGGTSGDAGFNGSLALTENLTTISYPSLNYCKDLAATPNPTITGTTGGTFSAPAGLSINASTGQVSVASSTAGAYNITYTYGGSNTVQTNMTISNRDAATVTYASASFCKDASNPTPTITGTTGGTFTAAPSGLSINTNTGLINLAASTAGNYNITYTTAGACPTTSVASVTIQNVNDAAFSYPNTTYCQTQSNPSPTISGTAGGTFSALPSGLSINTSTGLINLAASTTGNYNVLYTSPGTCNDTDTFALTVANTSSATLTYPSASYCKSSILSPVPNITGATGGTFSAPAGLAISTSTGVITLGNSTAGAYNITYATAGVCPTTSVASVTVQDINDAAFSYASTAFCQAQSNPSPNITGVAGGTFSALPAGLSINNTTGAINLSASTTGTYNVLYTSPGACNDTDTFAVTINANGNAGFSYSAMSVCAPAYAGSSITPSITGNAGGTFSASPAGLVINSNTGEVNLNSQAGGGSAPNQYNITYTVSGLCSATSSVSLTVQTRTLATVSFSLPTYCIFVGCLPGPNPPAPSITGGTGGVFSASPTGLVINANTGVIDLQTSSTGSYTVFYNNNAAPCPDTAQTTVLLTACPSVREIAAESQLFNILPNPNQGLFSVLPLQEANELRLTVLDMYGKIVHTQKIEAVANEPVSINLSHLADGLYFVRATQSEKMQTLRLSIQK